MNLGEPSIRKLVIAIDKFVLIPILFVASGNMIVELQLSHLNFRTAFRELQYIDAINITSNKEGWLTLNISEALDHWVNNPSGNQGLYLSVHPVDRSGKRFIFSSFLPLFSKNTAARRTAATYSFDV